MSSTSALLAATDFSAPARHAADRAARLARDMGVDLALMHVVPGPALQELRRWLGQDHEVERQVHEEASRQLSALASELQAHRHVRARSILASGGVLDAIVQEADAMDAGLLVLGARGTGFLRHLTLGSTSERLLRRTRRPVLIVRQTPHAVYRRVLVAVDFSGWSLLAVQLARRVAPRARLLLFHAFQVPFEEKLRFAGVDAATIERFRQQATATATGQLHALAAAGGLKPGDWEPCLVEGDASLRIIEHEQEQDCDLVVLGKHGQSAAEDLLLGSVCKHVLAQGSTDVLVSTAHAA